MSLLPALDRRPVAASPRLPVVDDATSALLWRAGLLAAVTELGLLRLFTRTAIHIPAFDFLARPYHAISVVARYAFFVSVVLLGVNLAMVVLGRRAAADDAARTGAATAFGFLAVAALARTDLIDPIVIAAAVVTLVAVAAALAALTVRGLGGVALAVYAVGFVTCSLHTIVEDGGRYGWRIDGAGALLQFGEATALLAVLVAAVAWGRRSSRRDLLVAAGAGLLVLGALLANGSTVKILLLWNFGLPGSLPAAVYALAAAGLTLALTGARRTGFPAVAGLALVVVGGVGLHSTYQSGLVIAGMLLLAGVVPSAGRPAPTAAS